jgi:hypothetical protein
MSVQFISQLLSITLVGRDSSVGIATCYGLHGPGIESRWGRDFSHSYGPALDPTQPPIRVFPESKAVGARRWLHTPSSAKVKESLCELYLYLYLNLYPLPLLEDHIAPTVTSIRFIRWLAWAGRPTNRCLIPGKYCKFNTPSQRRYQPEELTQPPNQLVCCREFFPEMQSRHGVGLPLTTSNVKLEYAWNYYTSAPLYFITKCLYKHEYSFIPTLKKVC